LALRCVEDIDNTTDVTPSDIVLSYAFQVPVSSRQSSSAVVIGGMSSGATTTLSVSANAGNPKFTVNGGAETTSATIKNGDSIVFLMDAPATASTSNRMAITSGGSTALGTWRVWTGDNGANLTKRIFVTSSRYTGNFGGVTGADSKCQTAANDSSLGGTWKAILSGGTAKGEWAVNRVGYNWSKLTLVDGTVVVYAPNLWTSSPSFLSPIVKTQTGATLTNEPVYTNTTVLGFPFSTDNNKNCFNWTTTSTGYPSQLIGNSSVQGAGWVNSGSFEYCEYYGVKAALYCIEQ
jgi:hypothetical protein